MIVLSEINDEHDVVNVINKVIVRVAQPYELDRITCKVTISIGASIFPDNGAELDELITKADAAMYMAKKNGKNQYNFSD